MAHVTINQLTQEQRRVLQSALDICEQLDDGQTIEALTHVIEELDWPPDHRLTWAEANQLAEQVIDAGRRLPAPKA